MENIELIVYLASALVVVSIAFKTTSFVGTLLMRILNGIGSICFVVYACIKQTNPVFLTNCVSLILNIVYLIIEIIQHKKNIKGVKVNEKKMSNTSR